MEPSQSIDPGRIKPDLERFVNAYCDEYISVVENEELPDEHLPVFYVNEPHKAHCFVFDNGTIGVFFVKGDETRVVNVKEGDFYEARNIINDRAFDRFISFENPLEITEEKGRELARKHARKDLYIAKKKVKVEKMKKDLEALEEQIRDVVKTNPWLEDRVAEQMSILSSTKETIEAMEKEVEELEEEEYREAVEALDDLELLPPLSIRVGGKTAKEEQHAEEMGETEKSEVGDEEKALEETATERQAGATEETVPVAVSETAETEMGGDKSVLVPGAEKALHPPIEEKESEEEKVGGFVEVKEEPIRPTLERMPEVPLPPEIKNTIFRMNRRLYNLEKKFAPIDAFYNRNIKKIRDETKRLQKDVRIAIKNNQRDMEQLKEMVALETRRIRKMAIGLSTAAIIISIIAVLLALRDLITSLI